MEKYARIRYGIHDNIIQCMRWLDKARNTHSEYVENIRFPHQQQLHIPTTTSFLSVHCLSYFCLSSQTVLLMNIRQQNSTQKVQTHIFLTKYISIKPIHTNNNVQHTNQQS